MIGHVQWAMGNGQWAAHTGQLLRQQAYHDGVILRQGVIPEAPWGSIVSCTSRQITLYSSSAMTMIAIELPLRADLVAKSAG